MGRRILLVDDHEDTLDLYAEAFGEAGFDVVRTTSALAAIEMAVAEVPDLIVTDIWMPEMNGAEMADAIRSRLPARRVGFVAVSAHAFDLAGQVAPHGGWDACVSKPCMPDVLISAARRILAAIPPDVSGARPVTGDDDDSPASKKTGSR